jgi:hypothetical protein
MENNRLANLVASIERLELEPTSREALNRGVLHHRLALVGDTKGATK